MVSYRREPDYMPYGLELETEEAHRRLVQIAQTKIGFHYGRRSDRRWLFSSIQNRDKLARLLRREGFSVKLT